MAINWNPDATDKVGLQHIGTGWGARKVDATHDVAELQFTSKHTGPISHWELYAGPGAAAPGLTDRYNELRRPVLLEMVNQGQEVSAGATYTDFPVSTIVGSASMFNANLTKPITTNQLATPNDGLFIVSSKTGAYFEVNFATGAFPLTWHVLAVEVRMRINLTTGVRRLDPTGEPWFYNVPEFSSQYILRTVRWGEVIVDGSASAWSHWTPAKVREFASTRKVRLSCQAGPGHWRMDWLQLRVHHVPERRRAVGIGMPAFANSWVSFPMTTPNATGAPSVTTGEQLTLMARRFTDYSPDVVAGQAILPWQYLNGRAPDDDWRLHNQPWPSWSEGFSVAGSQIDGIPAARALNAGSVVATSQPYSLSTAVRVYGAAIARQRLTLAGDGTVYGQMYAVVGWRDGQPRPQGTLHAEVRRVTGGAVVFSDTEVTVEDVAALPVAAFGQDREGNAFRVVRFRFPESTTLTAGSYEVRLSSPDTTEDRRWSVAAIFGQGHTTDQTFGGSTQYASGEALTIGGSVTDIAPTGAYTGDLEVVLAEVPAAVTGVGTSVGSWSAHDALVCTCGPGSSEGGCGSDTLPFVQLTWAAAPTGTPSVTGYNVIRTDDWTPGWEPVAYVDGRTTTTWDDHEARIGLGVNNLYRIQVVRSDGVTGDWSDVVSQQIATDHVALALSSNAATGMGCVYPEVWAGNEVERDWQEPAADLVSLRRFHGRNNPVAFRPLERPDRRFQRTLLLSAGCQVPKPSLSVYDPLNDLAHAPVPYVCVRDGEGNRWYASVTVPEEVNRRADSQGNELWLCTIEVVSVSDGPYQVDTSVAQVDGPASL